MNHFENFILALFIVTSAFGAGVTSVRYLTHRDWHLRYFHKCGFHTEAPISQIMECCAKCGETDNAISETKIMRATFLWGWEVKS